MSTKQKELTKELVEASKAYYGGQTPKMSDLEFDRKLAELRQMEEESGIVYDGSPTKAVGATVVTELKKIRHEQPALSLDKVKYADRENLKKWIGNKQAIMSWKCDGLTVVVTYLGGKLIQAVTRGNGEEGSDITHNARFFKGLPQTIPYTEKLVVRGEAVMTYAEFDRINAEEDGVYENPRNLAAATIQMLDANESRKREIAYKAFELVTPNPVMSLNEKEAIEATGQDPFGMKFMQDRLNWLESLDFEVVEHECADASDVLQKIEEWKENLPNLDYPTDGLVFSYQNLVDGWALGTTGHHPRWAMALKWTDETITTTIRDIEWSVGKTGVITPVAIFDEVRLGLGSNVTRASLHNLSVLQSLAGQEKAAKHGIEIIGSKAEVYMANMIIPQVASVTRTPKTKTAEVPTICPVCGKQTKEIWNPNSNVSVLVCTNHDGCPAQQVGKLMNTFGKDGLFVKGLGENQIQDLIEYGIVDDTPVSFYKATTAFSNGKDFSDKVVKLLEKDGWGKKKWENLVDAINASRNTTLQKFLYSLNIPLLGNDLSKKLAKFWHNDIEAFRIFIVGVDEQADGDVFFGEKRAMEMLSSIDGVGEEKARNIVEWVKKLIRDETAYTAFDQLCSELKFPKEEENAADQSLAGMTFVITGSVHEYKNRDEFKASVETRGGKVAGSVSKNTDFLVNNDIASTSGKNAKAKELNIPIISEDEFIERFGK